MGGIAFFCLFVWSNDVCSRMIGSWTEFPLLAWYFFIRLHTLRSPHVCLRWFNNRSSPLGLWESNSHSDLSKQWIQYNKIAERVSVQTCQCLCDFVLPVPATFHTPALKRAEAREQASEGYGYFSPFCRSSRPSHGFYVSMCSFRFYELYTFKVG